MSTTYSWKVNNLERTVVDGVVYVVHYSVSAADTLIKPELTVRVVSTHQSKVTPLFLMAT